MSIKKRSLALFATVATLSVLSMALIAGLTASGAEASGTDGVASWKYTANPIASATLTADTDYLALVTIPGETTQSRVRWVTDSDVSSETSAVLSEDSSVTVTVTHKLNYVSSADLPTGKDYTDLYHLKYLVNAASPTPSDLAVENPAGDGAAVSGARTVYANDGVWEYLRAVPTANTDITLRVVHARVEGQRDTEANLKAAVKTHSGGGQYWVTVPNTATLADVMAAADKQSHHSITMSSRYIDARNEDADAVIGNFKAGKSTYWYIGEMKQNFVSMVKVDGNRDSEAAVAAAERTRVHGEFYMVLTTGNPEVSHLLAAADRQSRRHSITTNSRYIDARTDTVTVHNFKAGKRTYWLIN